MGQYHYVVNLDRREYLHPHKFGDGLKLMEFGNSAGGTMTALSILLGICSRGGGRGGGDFRFDDPRVGSWAGDRIAIIGDYNEPEDLPGFTDYQDTPWHDEDSWHDISSEMRTLIETDGIYEFEIEEYGYKDQDGNEIRRELVRRVDTYEQQEA